MIVNSTPTTCTAKIITNWNKPNLSDKDPKVKVNMQLAAVKELIAAGNGNNLADNAIIYAFTTKRQNEYYGLPEFMEKCGFTMVFEGKKSNDKKVQREQETGNLFLWAAEPATYGAALVAFQKELTELKNKIDPPKKPDPKRKEFPTNVLSRMRKSEIVRDNSALKNRIVDILIVPEPAAYMFVKNTFGIDIRKWKNYGPDWTRLTVEQLKNAHKAWIEELV